MGDDGADARLGYGHSRPNSAGGEEQHGEADLGAVLASSGVAGVHGTVRHGGGGGRSSFG